MRRRERGRKGVSLKKERKNETEGYFEEGGERERTEKATIRLVDG